MALKFLYRCTSAKRLSLCALYDQRILLGIKPLTQVILFVLTIIVSRIRFRDPAGLGQIDL